MHIAASCFPTETGIMNIKVTVSYLVVLLLLYFVKSSLGQTVISEDRSSYEARAQEELQCDIDGTDRIIQWRDTSTDPEVIIFVYGKGDPAPQNRTTDNKYNNFKYKFESGSIFNLTINDVERNDDGVYLCQRTLDDLTDYSVSFSFSVEVPVTPVISNGSTVISDPLELILDNSYNLTCSAIGAKSVNDLQLMFSFETDGTGTTSEVNGEDSALTDYTKTVSYTPDDKNITSLSCSILGYGDVTEDENNVVHTVGVSVQYVPECHIMVSAVDNDDCRPVSLYCNCTAVPNASRCSFYGNNTSVGDASDCSMETDVSFNTLTEYTCQGTNDAGVGLESDPMGHECISDPPECNITLSPVNEDDCRDILLTCACYAAPKESSCSFHRNGSLFAESSDCSLTTSVTFNTTSNYSCLATNDVGPGLESEPVSHDCFSGCPCENGRCSGDEATGYECNCYDCYAGDICNLSPCDSSDIKEEKLELDIDGSSACDALLFSHGTNFVFSCPSGIEMVDRNSSGTCKDGIWVYESDIACKIASWFIGTIAGILVISVIAVIVLLMCWKKKKNKERSDGEDGKYNSAYTGDGGDRPDDWDDIDTGEGAVDPAATPIPLNAEPDTTKNGTKKEMGKPAEPPIYAESTKHKKSSKKGTEEPAAAVDPPIYAESTKHKKSSKKGTDKDAAATAPVYAQPNKDKTSQKSRDNGTPDPHVPMEDSSAYEGVEFKGKPQPGAEQGQKELQYAELDHKNVPADSKVIKPKDEPTQYADIGPSVTVI